MSLAIPRILLAWEAGGVPMGGSNCLCQNPSRRRGRGGSEEGRAWPQVCAGVQAFPARGRGAQGQTGYHRERVGGAAVLLFSVYVYIC